MENTMRVLIVADESLALTALANVLALRRDVEHFDSANDAIGALAKLATDSYDVLLLDIDTAELSGIELVDRLRERSQPLPSIVFVTAHNGYAIAALEKHTVDYVLKPFSNERIGQALDRASRRTAGEQAVELLEILLSRAQYPRIAIKAKRKIFFIRPGDLVAVQAEGNYVLLQHTVGSYVLRASISEVAEKLKPYGFIRIHRSVLVNTSFVEEIKPYLSGEYGLRIKGGREYSVTRSYKKNLKSFAKFWIRGHFPC
jgi:DNA-binding LytR/AlgR family response regulator